MKRIVKDWLLLLASLLDDAAVIVVILLILWLLKIPVSLSIIIILVLLFGGLVFLMHKFVIPTLHRKIITGSEGMLGLEGIVTKPLEPRGVVNINGKLWKARAAGDHIPVSKQVEVIAMDGITLHVKRKS